MSHSVKLCLAAIFAILAAGCSDVSNVAPADVADYSFADYFWPSAARTVTIDADSVTTVWQLADTIGARVMTRNTDRITFSTTGGTLLGIGFRSGTLIDLDPGTYFSGSDSLQTFVNAARVATYVESSGALYVGADSGVFVQDAGATTFRFAGLPGTVTSLTQNPAKSVIYVGLADGSIWAGSSAAWSKVSASGLPSGPIQALAFGVDQALYAAVSGESGFYRLADPGDWQQVPYMQSATITKLQSFYYSGSPRVMKCIVGATTTGEIGVYNVDGSPNPAPTFVASAINGFSNGADGALLAATNSGVLSGDVHNNTWTPLATPISNAVGAIHTWYPGSGSPMLFFSRESEISTSNLTGGSRSVQSSIPSGSVIALGHVGSRLYALTDRTCYEYESGWVEVPGLGRESIVRQEGPIVLARNPLRVGDTWHAGTLAVPDKHLTYSITARVLTHYDTLHVGINLYPDVLVIRYAHEDSGGLAESTNIPYFVVYYAKGLGIAMAEKVRNDAIVSRQVVTAVQ